MVSEGKTDSLSITSAPLISTGRLLSSEQSLGVPPEQKSMASKARVSAE